MSSPVFMSCHYLPSCHHLSLCHVITLLSFMSSPFLMSCHHSPFLHVITFPYVLSSPFYSRQTDSLHEPFNQLTTYLHSYPSILRWVAREPTREKCDYDNKCKRENAWVTRTKKCIREEVTTSSGGKSNSGGEGGVHRSTKEEQTAICSSTGANETVRIATLLLNIYLIETKGQQSGRRRRRRRSYNHRVTVMIVLCDLYCGRVRPTITNFLIEFQNDCLIT